MILKVVNYTQNNKGPDSSGLFLFLGSISFKKHNFNCCQNDMFFLLGIEIYIKFAPALLCPMV